MTATTGEAKGFLPEAAWEFYAPEGDSPMPGLFRGGYRQGFIDGRATAVQQPNRDAVWKVIADLPVPAWWGGEQISEAVDAVLAALAVPATGEVQYTVGMVNSNGS